MGDYLLKEVTDAEGEAFPAEAGSGNEVEGRLPVQGELQRNLLEAVFETELGTYADPELGGGTKGMLIGQFCTVTGTDTNGARLCGGHYGQTQDSCHYK